MIGSYLDASVIVAIVANEPTRSNVEAALAQQDSVPVVSDLCHSEASAAIMRLHRIGRIDQEALHQMLFRLDDWALVTGDRRTITSTDVDAATTLVRRHDLALRAPDAIHIAAAHRLGTTLLTLDKAMARAAAALGVPCIHPVEAEAPGDPKD